MTTIEKNIEKEKTRKSRRWRKSID